MASDSQAEFEVRLRQAHEILDGRNCIRGRNYIRALGRQSGSEAILRELKATTDPLFHCGGTVLINAISTLYMHEMEGMGVSTSAESGDSTSKISVHFVAYALNRIPEGRTGTPLKRLLSEFLKEWVKRNPTKLIQPMSFGKPVSNSAWLSV